MEINIEFIREQLRRRAGERQLRKVADGSKVPLRTVHRVSQGAACRLDTAERLQTYLKQTERKKRLDDAGQ